jgi:hypothetical protein
MGLMGERNTAYTVFNGKSEGNITLGKTSGKYEDNNKMDHNEKNTIVWHRFICFWIWTNSGLLSTLMFGSPAGSGDFSVLQTFQSGSDAQYPYSTLLEAPSLALK